MTASRTPRLLFCSYHCLVDPSSGAALATRDLLELLSQHDWACAAFCGPLLDFEHPEALEQLLADQGLPFQAYAGPPQAVPPFTLFHFLQNGIPVTVFRPASVVPFQPPTRGEGGSFLHLLEAVMQRFQPDVLLTYGGFWVFPEIAALAHRHGARVVFGLHNFAYTDPAMFRSVDAVLVPSEFSRSFYQRTLGLECTAIPYPLFPSRLCCPHVEPRYATFVNPQPHKGVFLFVRLAVELARTRPDIPLLVVEGRARAESLAQAGLDLTGLANLHRMANTPDPRHFYQVSRVVLMPSLWNESFGRVAAEACLNGIPVLASRRGALPEILAEAGFLFDVDPNYTPETRLVPSAAEMAPWLETLIRLWDDPVFFEQQRHRCRRAAAAWQPEVVFPRYEAFFRRVLTRRPRE